MEYLKTIFVPPPIIFQTIPEPGNFDFVRIRQFGTYLFILPQKMLEMLVKIVFTKKNSVPRVMCVMWGSDYVLVSFRFPGTLMREKDERTGVTKLCFEIDFLMSKNEIWN